MIYLNELKACVLIRYFSAVSVGIEDSVDRTDRHGKRTDSDKSRTSMNSV